MASTPVGGTPDQGNAERDYGAEYSDESFWEKLAVSAIKAGKEIVEKALVLYYCLQDDDTPAWARGTIMGALGYLILPTDAVPDILPGAGYADDLAVIAVAFALVLAHIKREHKRAAKEKTKEWFGDDVSAD